MQRAAKLVELLVEQSVQGLSTLGRETRRWLRSAKRQEVDQRPLARLQNPESQARYAGYIVKFVCYLLRIIADGEQMLAQRRLAQQTSSNKDRDKDRDRDRMGTETETGMTMTDGGDNGDDWHEDHGQNHRHDPAPPPPLRATAHRMGWGGARTGMGMGMGMGMGT